MFDRILSQPLIQKLTNRQSALVLYGWSLFAGLLWGYSYPPHRSGFIAIIAFAIWLRLLPGLRPGQGFRVWFTGAALGWYLLLKWMIYLMGHGGKGDVPALIVGMVLQLSVMALYSGALGFVMAAGFRQWGKQAYLLFPFFWAGEEWLRSLGPVSFPWMNLAYTVNWFLPVMQFLSVGGIYYYSFLVAGSASILAFCLDRETTPVHRIRSLGLAAGVWIFLLIFGAIRLVLNPAVEKQPEAEKIKVSLIQANIDQSVKWDMRWLDSTFVQHQEMTRRAGREFQPDLVVWPEASLPTYFLRRQRYVGVLSQLIKSVDRPLLFGSLHYEREPRFKRGVRFYNSLFFGRPDTNGFLRYDKMRLLPFQEALPFEDVFPVLSTVDLGEADFSPGKSTTPFTVKGKTGVAVICYEICYPGTIRKFTGAGVDFVVQCTNDAWFGRSGMPYQHHNLARFRAIENGLPLVTAANSGFSMTFDAWGRERDRSELFTNAIVNTSFVPRKSRTLYSLLGDWVGWASAGILLCGMVMLWRGRKTRLKAEP
jgi:apolipoprotein N-acyltransferase